MLQAKIIINNAEDMKGIIRQAISDKTKHNIKPNSGLLKDYGLDSLDIVELGYDLKNNLGVDIRLWEIISESDRCLNDITINYVFELYAKELKIRLT